MHLQPVAVVTGANRGIGLEIARNCAGAGFHVVVATRDEAAGRAVAQELGCSSMRLDLNDRVSIAACAGELKERYGQIDVLVNNASMAYKHADTTPWTQKTRLTVNTNFFGTAEVCEALLPLVRPGGRVVIVASGSGHLSLLGSRGHPIRNEFARADSSLTLQQLCGMMNQFVADVLECRSLDNAPSANWPHVAKGWPNSAYGMSKLGQVALTKIYARELAPRGISVNCCCPGDVSTDMNPRGALTPAQGADTPAWLAVQPAAFATGQFFKNRVAVEW
mmetsp:Transcript_62419/g.145290  ORF Transcript_62419/g.145290 Transcript_62419/m.145290 type:complete len:278 (-) Transcript_62419:61-894(-)